MLLKFQLTYKLNNKRYKKTVPVTVKHDDKLFYLYSEYDEELLDEFRAMQGSRWFPDDDNNGRGKCWTAPCSLRNIIQIEYLTGRRPAAHARYYEPVRDTFPRDSKRTLFTHQKSLRTFGINRRQCILSGDMGVGKTLAAIEIMEYAYAYEGMVNWWLVAPDGAQRTWKRELIKWNTIVDFQEISTYESLHRLLERELPQGIIFDESIKIKTPAATRSRTALQLAGRMRNNDPESYILLLSGAPAPRVPSDWWHQVEVACPGWLREGDIHKFVSRYANIKYIEGDYGTYPKILNWKMEEVKALGRRLSPVVIRINKADCFDLPDKIFEELGEIDKKSLTIALTIAGQQGTAIGELNIMRQISDGFVYEYENPDEVGDARGQRSTNWIGSNKLAIVDELLDVYDPDNGGCGRIIFYAAFQASVDKLQEHIIGKGWMCGRIDGRGWSTDSILDTFDDIDTYPRYAVVANPACVMGLNFQKTEALVYYSNTFQPNDRVQSLDRRDRPGMDTTKGTRIIDIINLPTDRKIIKLINGELKMQDITLEAIKECLNGI